MAAFAAVMVPVLLAYNASPSSTFLNQATALAGWAAFVTALTVGARFGPTRPVPGALLLLSVIALLSAGVFASNLRSALPGGLAFSALGFLAACGLAVSVAVHVSGPLHRPAAFRPFAIAIAISGMVSLAIACIQYFSPELADGNWLAHPSAPGRVGGNLRQPNHLSTLLLWSTAGVIWLHAAWLRQGSMPAPLLHALAATAILGLTFGVVLTVSRTGAVCILLLTVWGVVDRELPRFTRVLLWILPVVFGLMWFGVSEWAQTTQHAFAGGDQLSKGDLSSSRFGIWSNTLALIKQHPWTGVGWGEFNFAWTLTPFPGRPIAFFDHTHNLPLHLAVELGLPLATLIMALVLAALWLAWRQLRQQTGLERATTACALVMVLMIGVHSLLEYPLWYAYFLLPTAFAFGIAVGVPPREEEAAVGADHARRGPPQPTRRSVTMMIAAAVLFVGTGFAVVDYLRVVHIFAPPADAAPLEDRIAEGQRSWFFAHHAHYAAATTNPRPSEAMASFANAPHFLLDARLMVAWSKALAERGEVEKARYVADRLREFRHPLGTEFFAACDNPPTPGTPEPFQCKPATQVFTFEDFRAR
ncbi:Wzy polymerase domain-containing protein [Rhizobacter sp. LjRoot28]